MAVGKKSQSSSSDSDSTTDDGGSGIPTIPAKAIDAFATKLLGYVTLPGSANYTTEKLIYNEARFGTNPDGIILVKSIQDVRQAVLFLLQFNQHPRVKGGGHSYLGLCQQEHGWVIDLRYLKDFEINHEDHSISFGAGNLLTDIYLALDSDASDLKFAGGAYHEVGASGYILGGGRSSISRVYGWAVDTVIEMTVVTAEGKIVHASRTKNKDLFWALCGAGHNNYGIVVNFHTKVYQTKVAFGVYSYDVSDNQELASKFFQRFIETSGPTIMSKSVTAYPILQKGTVLFLIWAVGDKCTTDPKAIAEQWLDVFQEDFPPLNTVVPLAYSSQFAQSLRLPIPNLNMRFNTKSYYVKSIPHPKKYFDSIINDVFSGLANNDTSVPNTFYIIQYGGRMSEFPENELAVSHRSAQYLPTLETDWDDQNFDDIVNKNANQVFDNAHKKNKQKVLGSYVNYPDADNYDKDWQQIYYGQKEKRLQRIKSKWDPIGFFQHEFGVKAAQARKA